MKPAVKHLDISPAYGRKLASLPRWKQSLVGILPLYTIAQLRFETKLAWTRFRQRGIPRRYRGATGLKVNLGCGVCGHDGWVNVDARPGPTVNCVWDCRKELPFPDGSTRLIFTEHFFEHVDYTAEAPYFLAECRRVLQPGGVIRIIVPDAERYLRAYTEPGWEALRRLRELDERNFDRYTDATYRTKMELVNEVFRQSFTHKFAYDYETLERLLLDAGFSRVQRQEFGRSLEPDLLLDLPSRAHESLYVEAVAG